MLLELVVSENDAGQRADRYIRRRLPHLTGSRMHSLFRRKEIKIGREVIGPGHILVAQEKIRLYGLREEEAGESTVLPITPVITADFHLSVIHADADMLVIDKPAGMAVHPGTGIGLGQSLIEKATAYLAGASASSWNADEVFRPALVHRLDKETSGVILIAKTGGALRALTSSLREGGFRKNYIALVEGRLEPTSGIIDDPLMRVDSRKGGAKILSDSGGKTAVTRYQTLKNMGNYTLVDVIIETGRMHQIRSHLSGRGHPIIGDDRYGSFELNRTFRKQFELRRMFLHASSLEVDWNGATGRFEAPLSAELSDCLRRLESSL